MCHTARPCHTLLGCTPGSRTRPAFPHSRAAHRLIVRVQLHGARHPQLLVPMSRSHILVVLAGVNRTLSRPTPTHNMLPPLRVRMARLARVPPEELRRLIQRGLSNRSTCRVLSRTCGLLYHRSIIVRTPLPTAFHLTRVISTLAMQMSIPLLPAPPITDRLELEPKRYATHPYAKVTTGALRQPLLLVGLMGFRVGLWQIAAELSKHIPTHLMMDSRWVPSRAATEQASSSLLHRCQVIPLSVAVDGDFVSVTKMLQIPGGPSLLFCNSKAMFPLPHILFFCSVSRYFSRGCTQSFACDHSGHGLKAGKSGTNCGWSIKYEDSSEGWVLVAYNRCHSVRGKTDQFGKPISAHELELSQDVLRARSSGRPGIPQDFVPVGQLMAKAGMGPAHIKDVLDTKGREEGLDLSDWSYKDVYEAFPASVGKRDFDAAGVVELLQKRAEILGMRYFAQVDELNFVKRIFAQLDDSTKEWARCKGGNVVLFDPTHGTNRYGMKLCCFTTVGPTGQTVILAVAIIKYEDTADIEWAFRCFASVFKTAPVAIYTDSGASILAAFENVSDVGDVWEGVQHALCVFHLSKNCYSHLRPLFVSHPEIWQQVHSMFWNLAKNSDVTFATTGDWSALLSDIEPSELSRVQRDLCSADPSRTSRTFEEGWKELFDLVDEKAHGSTKDAGLRFLRSLYASRHKWAACFTWSRITWGLNSTQRAEAIHSAIKRRKSLANFSMVTLIEMLVNYNNESRDRRAVDEVRRRITQVANGASVPEWINAVTNRTPANITPYACELLFAQTAQALKYKFIDTGHTVGGCEVFEVVRDSSVDPLPSALVYDEWGQIVFGEDDEDFGLSRSRYSTFRLTTLNVCSCQLQQSLAIPCRHILGLRILQQGGDERAIDILDLIGVKWHHMSNKVESQLVRELLRRPSRSQALPEAAREMNKQERYNLLLHELTSLAELGSESLLSMERLLQALPMLSSKLDQPSTSASSATRDSHGDIPAARNAGCTEDEPGSQSLEAEITHPKEYYDYKQLLGVIGQRFEIDDRCPSEMELVHLSDEGKALVGCWIAFKNQPKNKGGWQIARIEEQIYSVCDEVSDPDSIPWNFSVHYHGLAEPEDELLEYAEHTPYPALYSNHQQGAWTLLKERGLGHDVAEMARQGTIHNPQVPPKKGRKETARKATAFGPMSKKRKGQHSAPTRPPAIVY
jgi:hypothetical protein